MRLKPLLTISLCLGISGLLVISNNAKALEPVRLVAFKNGSSVTVLQRIHPALLDRVDSFTAPILEQYTDPNPCKTDDGSESTSAAESILGPLQSKALQEKPGTFLPKPETKENRDLTVRVPATGPEAFPVILFVFSKDKPVELSNMRTSKLLANRDLPFIILTDPARFFSALLSEQDRRQGQPTVFAEYIGRYPGAAEDLQALGVPWAKKSAPVGPYVSRFHWIHHPMAFPEDLKLKDLETAPEEFRVVFRSTSPFVDPPSTVSATKKNQGRNRKVAGAGRCPQAKRYQTLLQNRLEKEANVLAALTGWNIQEVRHQMKLKGRPPKGSFRRWFEKLWQEWTPYGTESESFEEAETTSNDPSSQVF